MISRFTKFITKQKRYFDYASITPIDPRVLKVVHDVSKDSFHNPGSLYTNGVFASKILQNSRLKIAEIFSGKSANSVHQDEIVFTSGGTESNNIALQGVIDKWYEDKNYDYTNKPHIIISEIEHPSVKNIVENLYKKNKITFSKIKILPDGVIDLLELKDELINHRNTILVSIMLVNNEIGTIQPIRDIASLIRKAKDEYNYPLLHTDACQAMNYLDIPFDKMGVDLLSIDGGKVYGPRGVGVLYVKRKTSLNPIYFGGDQEYGLRPGTENLAGIAGLIKALEIISKEKEKEIKRLSKMQSHIFNKVKKIKGIYVNGSTEKDRRIVNNINLCLKGQDAEFLLFKMDKLGYEVSIGTTCQNKKEESRSISVDALGDDCGGSSLRISLGRFTTMGQVRGLVKALKKVLK